jgi:hypothetical protein
MGLGRVCKSEPEHDRGKGHHRQEVDRSLLIPSCHAPELGTPSPHTLDCPLLHQCFQFGGLVTLTSSEHKGHRFAFSFRTQMQFSAETTLTLA